MNRDRKLVGPSAIVGASELVASVTKMIQPSVYIAKTVEEAKDWLVSQPE